MNIILFILIGAIMSSSALAENILYIGDSHSHIREQSPLPANRRFGNAFYETMVARGHKVTYYAACGSKPIDWVKGAKTECGYTYVTEGSFLSVTSSNYPSISSIYKPELYSKIVINQGDNMFDWPVVSNKKTSRFNKASFENSINSFLKLLPDVSSANCTWIGPTYHIAGRDYNKLNSVVDEFYSQLNITLADRCRIIDSRSIVIAKEPNDGLHHVSPDSEAWALGVLNLL